MKNLAYNLFLGTLPAPTTTGGSKRKTNTTTSSSVVPGIVRGDVTLRSQSLDPSTRQWVDDSPPIRMALRSRAPFELEHEDPSSGGNTRTLNLPPEILAMAFDSVDHPDAQLVSTTRALQSGTVTFDEIRGTNFEFTDLDGQTWSAMAIQSPVVYVKGMDEEIEIDGEPAPNAELRIFMRPAARKMSNLSTLRKLAGR